MCRGLELGLLHKAFSPLCPPLLKYIPPASESEAGFQPTPAADQQGQTNSVFKVWIGGLPLLQLQPIAKR